MPDQTNQKLSVASFAAFIEREAAVARVRACVAGGLRFDPAGAFCLVFQLAGQR